MDEQPENTIADHAEEEEFINTIDELAFEYGRNALLLRWVASILDLIVLGGVFFVIHLLMPSLAAGASMLLFPIILGTWLGYFFCFEALWGATPGKLMVNIRVVDSEGNTPDRIKTAVRTVARLIEANPVLLGGIPAVISAFTSKVSQRIGDRIAGTYVLRKKHLDLMLYTDTQNGVEPD